MSLFQAHAGVYHHRIQRAQHLAQNYPFAAEFLNFFQSIALFQKSLYARIAAEHAAAQRSNANAKNFVSTEPAQLFLKDNLDLTIILPHFRAFLDVTQRSAPAPLANSARELVSQPTESWITLLSNYWTNAGCSGESSEAPLAPDPFSQFFPRAFLQPYAEFLAEQLPKPQLLTTNHLCPFCGTAPLLGVLRPEGDSGKRFLLCSFCSQEWDYRRILCPACGENSETKLPVYVAEQFAHIRVEACDTCHSYLRTIDLTKDGHAIPIVDDLAALPLSLWAQEHGYARPQPNLLGT